MIQSSQQSRRRFGYQKVADSIRAAITAGQWREGEQLPSLDDMVERFGYSRMTVFKALQQLESQGVVTMGRGRGTFVREQVARPAVGFVTQVLLEQPNNRFATVVAAELADRLHQRGWSIRLYADRPGGGSGSAPWELQEALENRALAGLISVNSNLPIGFMRTREWQDLAVPHVDLSGHQLPTHKVEADDLGAYREVLRACQQHAIDSLGIISYNPDGCRQIIEAGGVTVPAGWAVGCPPGMDYEEAGFMLVRQLWQRPERPRALFVGDDIVAKGVAQGILSLGIQVPDELVFIANTNSGAGLFYPLPVVRVVLDTARIAQEMLDLLDALIARPDLPPERRRVEHQLQA